MRPRSRLRALERIELPNEAARARARAVVSAVFAEREPQPRRRVEAAAAVAAALVVLAGLLSPPGRAVPTRSARSSVSRRARRRSSPPARVGRIGGLGSRVVEQDGSKRLLRPYREASWSPFGRFVVATRANELVALTPGGTVRWSLARPNAPAAGGIS